MTIQAVIWDYGGVISIPPFSGLDGFEADMGYPAGSMLELMFGESSYIETLSRGTSTEGVTPAEPEARHAVTHDWHRLETGDMTLADYFISVTERAPRILGAPVDLEAYQRYARSMHFGIHWPVVHRIRELRRDGFATGLLTNNVKEFGSAWRASIPVDEIFDAVVDSSEVGLRKPDPRIYELTCEKLGVEPDAAVFLDDNRSNVEAARALGMATVHVADGPIETLTALDAILDGQTRGGGRDG